MSKYMTIGEAANAMCLELGYDPFLHGPVRAAGRNWHKVSLASLRAMGYIVMTKAERQEERKKRDELPILQAFCWAADCGGREGDGTEWDYSLSLYTPQQDGGWRCPQYDEHVDLGMIKAKSRAEAKAKIMAQFRGKFSSIQFSG